jgi:hypothetical protein
MHCSYLTMKVHTYIHTFCFFLAIVGGHLKFKACLISTSKLSFFYSILRKQVPFKVARWYIFKPKIPIWVNFGGPCSGRWWPMYWPFGKVCDHLVYFMAIWYIFHSFGILHQEKIWQPWFRSVILSVAEFMAPVIQRTK